MNDQEKQAGRVLESFASFHAHVIQTGRDLTKARADIPRGQWTAFLRDVHMTPAQARKLEAIANHPVLANPKHASVLPPVWMTLAELERLQPEWLERAITAGKAEMERKQARRLLRRLGIGGRAR